MFTTDIKNLVNHKLKANADLPNQSYAYRSLCRRIYTNPLVVLNIIMYSNITI